MKNLSYEEELERRKELANLIWDNPFMSGLTKFKKSDLLILIRLLTDRLSSKLCDFYDELDWKDSAFEFKCNIIETLDENFFKRQNNENKNKTR